MMDAAKVIGLLAAVVFIAAAAIWVSSTPRDPVEKALHGVRLNEATSGESTETTDEEVIRERAKARLRRMFMNPEAAIFSRWAAVSSDGTDHGETQIACGFVDARGSEGRTGDKMYILEWSMKGERICHEDALPKACNDLAQSPLFAACVQRMRAHAPRA